MSSSAESLHLNSLSWMEIRDRLERDRRLIVPVGACDQYGPHLPIGAATMIVDVFADQLSRDFDVLRAPTLDYGVNLPAEYHFPGTGTLREKTLHSILNDLLASWEDDGFNEFILLTVHDYDSHVEAMATVTGTSASIRVRVIEILNMDLSAHLDGTALPQHGGETLTSLFLHLYPDRVRLDRITDFDPGTASVSTFRRLQRLPAGSPGCVGQPSLATAEKGRRLYEYIYEKIRTRVFMDPS
jgi:creatinine amidohydrolase